MNAPVFLIESTVEGVENFLPSTEEVVVLFGVIIRFRRRNESAFFPNIIIKAITKIVLRLPNCIKRRDSSRTTPKSAQDLHSNANEVMLGEENVRTMHTFCTYNRSSRFSAIHPTPWSWTCERHF